MPGFTRPDVYVEEALLKSNAPVNSTTAVAAFVSAALRGPVVPVRCQSWSDVVKFYGDFTGIAAQDVLRQAMFDALNNGARTCYGVRAAGAGAAAAALAFSVTLDDETVGNATGVTFTADNPGVWGNDLYVEILDGTDDTHKNVVIRLVPTGAAITNQQIVERWQEVSLNPADPRYLLSLLNSSVGGSDYVTVALTNAYVYVDGDRLTNSGVAGGSKLTGGADGAGVTGTVLRDAVYTLDVVTEPFVLNLPGVTDATTIGYLADYADASRTRTDGDPGRGDVFVVVDCDPSVTEATAAAKASTYVKSDCLATYYPQVIVNDSSNLTRGSTKLVPVGPLVVGRYMATDAARGAFKSPAGTTDGVLNGVVALDPVAKLRNADLNLLFAANVNAIRTFPGRAAAIIWGMRTLKSDYVTRYISARRTLISVRADLKQSTLFAMSENNDSFLWASLYNVADRICRELHAAGGLKGASAAQAYFVKCDEDNNTESTIENGEVVLEVGLALQRPAEFILLRISQFAGGTTSIEEVPAA